MVLDRFPGEVAQVLGSKWIRKADRPRDISWELAGSAMRISWELADQRTMGKRPSLKICPPQRAEKTP